MTAKKIKLCDWLHEKPFEMAMASGYFAFYSHTGFVKALEEHELKPRHLYGSSAGSIVTACLASGLKSADIEQVILSLKVKDFFDLGLGPGLIKGHKFQNILESSVCKNFSDLETPLHIAAFNVSKLRPQIITEGEVASAVRASCALPGLFQPVRRGSDYFLDGGLGDELGTLNRNSEHPLLVHFIEGLPLLDFSKRRILRTKQTAVFVTHSNLPRSGLNKLHLGKEILDLSYKMTKERLNQFI